jgi:hypothetical protein
VLVRLDGRPTYNFAAAVDDGAMRIDLVLRGDDHLTNTAIQILVFRALGNVLPEFAHLPMVLGPDGERLSKRHGAASVGSWRERGVPPEALVNALALLGWAPAGGDATIVPREELVRTFDLDRVGRSAAVFDPTKLEWISSQYIRTFPRERLASEVGARLAAAGLLVREEAADAWVSEVAELLRPTLSTFGDAAAQAEPLFHPGGPLDDEARAVLAAPDARGVVQALASALSASRSWTRPRGLRCAKRSRRRPPREAGRCSSPSASRSPAGSTAASSTASHRSPTPGIARSRRGSLRFTPARCARSRRSLDRGPRRDALRPPPRARGDRGGAPNGGPGSRRPGGGREEPRTALARGPGRGCAGHLPPEGRSGEEDRGPCRPPGGWRRW